MSLLRWTSKSTAKLAGELVREGYRVSADTVGRLLKMLGYSLQAPSKQKEGTSQPDRDTQFHYLNAGVGDVDPDCSGRHRRRTELVSGYRLLRPASVRDLPARLATGDRLGRGAGRPGALTF